MTDSLLRTFNFNITLAKSREGRLGSAERTLQSNLSDSDFLADGGFQECSGLDIEMDVQELEEGGRNDGVIQRVGRGKFSSIVLKRGMFYSADGTVNRDLWNWLQGIISGRRPVARYDGIIHVFGETDTDFVATWTFERGLPSKISGPSLNAKNGEVAIEELHIAHQGLKLVADT